MSNAILTIGYEGRTVAQFSELLEASDVEVLVDVRERPLSRKRGFGKSALQRLLAAMGKSYIHLQALGSPRELRAKLRSDGDHRRFFAAYRVLIAAPERAREIEQLRRLVMQGKNVCLMCFETDADRCHRSVVAEKVRQELPELEVMNL